MDCISTFNCQLCNFKVMSQEDLQLHEHKSHIELKYLCESCDYQAKVGKIRKEDILPNKLKCGNCEKLPCYAYLPDGYKQRINQI